MNETVAETDVCAKCGVNPETEDGLCTRCARREKVRHVGGGYGYGINLNPMQFEPDVVEGDTGEGEIGDGGDAGGGEGGSST
jgi:hypothetical protein